MGDRTDELARVIQTASDLGASLVRVLRADAAAETRRFDAFAAKVVPLADTAAAAGVTLLLENEPIPGSVSRLWRVMDEANHPSVACCWSADNGRLARELPLVSIPMLNSRIRMVRFGDVSGPEIPKKKILQRLAGIGFAGWVLVDRESEDQVRGAHAGLRSELISLKSAVRTGHIKA
jgi:sugar phosphate isomerase/epimerase